MSNEDKPAVKMELTEGGVSEEKRHFKTTDIALAASIRASGHRLVSIGTKSDRGRRSGKKTEFVFMKDGMQDVILAFTNNELQVDAKTLLDHYRNLKAAGLSKGIR